MEGGDLFTLLFWGVIILLSLLQSVVQGKKKQQPAPRPPDEDMEAGWEDTILFDDEETPVGEEKASSMIPGDVWDEIAGLARDREAAAGTELERGPEPAPVDPMEDPHRPPYRSRAEIQAERREEERERIRRERKEVVQERSADSVARDRVGASGLPASRGEARSDHPIHRSHAGYGSDPSTRADRAASRPSPTAAHGARRSDAGAVGGDVKELLNSSSPSLLKKAFVLREVLGPPKGLE